MLSNQMHYLLSCLVFGQVTEVLDKATHILNNNYLLTHSSEAYAVLSVILKVNPAGEITLDRVLSAAAEGDPISIRFICDTAAALACCCDFILHFLPEEEKWQQRWSTTELRKSGNLRPKNYELN